jgi:transcriptional regulator with XRE-family HTH domain
VIAPRGRTVYIGLWGSAPEPLPDGAITVEAVVPEEDQLEDPTGYGRKVGERLRAIRRQKGLSLQDVEASSTQEFKASVLGAYERGERAISVPRLQRLARFYTVPVDQLLPREEGETGTDVLDLTEASGRDLRASITIDLSRLRDLESPTAQMLVRYLQMIQVQRQDFNGRMLTVRRDDLRAIACILDTTLDQAIERLDDLGLCLTT